MGQAARRKAVDRYDWNEILPQVVGRYEALVGGHPYVGRIVAGDMINERERIHVAD